MTRGARGAARRAARAARREDRRRRPGRRSGGPCGARPDGGVFRSDPVRRLERPHRQADPQYRQHRHRRLVPRAGDGLSRAARLQRPRRSLSASSPMSTAPRSQRRRRTSIRTKPCSSSPRRRSPRSRRWPTRRRRGAWALAALGDEKAVARISWRFRPTPKGSRNSASTRPTCSASGIGSAAATRWIRRSACPP